MPIRWGWFAIALALVWAAQSGVVWPLGLARWIDLYLLLVLVLALTAPRYDAALAGWITGLVQDLASADVLGIHALCLGLTAWLIARLRERVNLSLTAVRIAASALTAFACQLVYLLHLRFWIVRHDGLSLLPLLTQAALTCTTAALIAGWITASGFGRQRRPRIGSPRRRHPLARSPNASAS